MKIKLYRGPAHGKCYVVQPHLTEVMVSWQRQPKKMKGWQSMGFTSGHANFATGNMAVGPGYLYIAPISANAGPSIMHRAPVTGVARYVKTQHTHPDGSVFFEYEKPRNKK